MTSTAATALPSPNKAIHITLWVLQALLALAFIGAGASKATQPIAELAKNMSFVTWTPEALVRFIGVAELLGGLGLVVPAATRILPFLTPLAAAGLTTIMALAAGAHLMHNEAGMVPVNVVLGGLTALIAWGRLKKAPIAPR